MTVATQYLTGMSQDWLDDTLAFSVVDAKDVAGVLNLRTRIDFKKFEKIAGPRESEVGS